MLAKEVANLFLAIDMGVGYVGDPCCSLQPCPCSKRSTVTGSLLLKHCLRSVFVNHPSHPKYNQQPVAVTRTSPGALQFT